MSVSEDTIAAVATAMSASGIGIVRISDRKPGKLPRRCIVPGEEKSSFSGRKAIPSITDTFMMGR